MRLIDVDAINPMRCPRSIAEMREWLDEQPTAYDVDKVVEKLEESSRIYCEEYNQREGSLHLLDAIEIVKGGGRDE